jgi:hypothetical protein
VVHQANDGGGKARNDPSIARRVEVGTHLTIGQAMIEVTGVIIANEVAGVSSAVLTGMQSRR